MINGIGAILGPLVASLLMSAFEASAYFWSLIITNGAILAYVSFRIIVRDPLPIDEQSEYQPYPARSSMVAQSIGRVLPKVGKPKSTKHQ